MDAWKRLTWFFLCLVFIACAAGCLAEAFDSGDDGNIHWEISRSSEEYFGYALTVTGSGDMRDYDPPNDCCPGTVHAPWILDFVKQGSPYGRNFNQITIGEGITRIGRYAFCIMQGQYMGTIEEIVIPSSVRSIGEGAFVEVGYITRLVVPDSVEEIESGAIKLNINIVCSAGSEAYRYAKEHGNRVILTDGSLELEQEELTLRAGDIFTLDVKVSPAGISPVFSSRYPDVAAVDGSTGRIIALKPGTTTVTVRAENLYRTCAVHVEPASVDPALVLTLPGSLTEIGDEAFAGIASKKVVLSDGTAVIGARAFADCPDLRFLEIPKSVTSISDDALAGCSDVIIVCSAAAPASDWARNHDCYVVYSSYR